MKPLSIPIHAAPADARHDDDALQYPEMPRGMATFSMPHLPEDADTSAVKAAQQLLQTFLDALNDWTFDAQATGPRLDLRGQPEAVLNVLDEVLGEGEVSARVEGLPGCDVRVQESVFTGLWRVRELDVKEKETSEKETSYWLEASSLPTVLLDAAHRGAQPALPDIAFPEGAMNAPALFTEIRAQLASLKRNGAASSHEINLTLLPLTPADHQALQEALPVGSLAIISKSFGSCRVTSTGARHVWRVQQFNNKNTLILNTLVVAERPSLVLAAAEDIEDARGRLAELISWMRADTED
ncbi:MAG: hydrogenase expression/formation protein [Proteobacteria bacterium]|nr:hydrogenase expression/formation protein [Pseudomonadota bacterium]MCL2307927.1 hydrogenase expression/formation protein [Pseudomonadota bacterium]